MTQKDDEFEYLVVGWRDYEKEGVQAQLERLMDEGWELDGNEYVKVGMLVDLTNQRLRRRSK